MRRRKATRIGSVEDHDEDDPRVILSEPFATTTVLVSEASNLSLAMRAARAGRVGCAIVPTAPQGSPQTAAALADAGVGVAALTRALRGALDAATAKIRFPSLAGLVVPYHTPWKLDPQVNLEFLYELFDAVNEANPELSTALLMPPHVKPSKMSEDERAALKHIPDLADVILLQPPPNHLDYAPEYWCGTIYRDLRHFLGYDLAKRTFILYRPTFRENKNHVLRFRAWMRDRGIRGYGYSEMPHDAGRGPYLGSLPAKVPRIDDARGLPPSKA